MRNVRGMFIVIEGLDGAGTTTQASKLVRTLEANGRTVVATREPSTGPFGVMARQALGRRLVMPGGDRIDPAVLALLFAADRMDHLAALVRPALARGAVVVSDRYVHSSLAYQSTENDAEWIAEINSRADVADLTIFIEVPAEECARRIMARGDATEIFEAVETLQRVGEAYEAAIAKRPDNVVRVDGTLSIDAVAALIATEVAQRLG